MSLLYLRKTLLVVLLAGKSWGLPGPSCTDLSGQAVSVDVSWIGSVPLWYFPICSQAFLYSAARTITGRNSEQLNPNQSCMTAAPASGGFTTSAFGSKKFYGVIPIKGMDIYETCADGEDYCERGYVTMTDNKSYLLTAICMRGNMAWYVISPTPDLPEQTKQAIWNHVEGLGFKRENFLELHHDRCV